MWGIRPDDRSRRSSQSPQPSRHRS